MSISSLLKSPHDLDCIFQLHVTSRHVQKSTWFLRLARELREQERRSLATFIHFSIHPPSKRQARSHETKDSSERNAANGISLTPFLRHLAAFYVQSRGCKAHLAGTSSDPDSRIAKPRRVWVNAESLLTISTLVPIEVRQYQKDLTNEEEHPREIIFD